MQQSPDDARHGTPYSPQAGGNAAVVTTGSGGSVKVIAILLIVAGVFSLLNVILAAAVPAIWNVMSERYNLDDNEELTDEDREALDSVDDMFTGPGYTISVFSGIISTAAFILGGVMLLQKEPAAYWVIWGGLLLQPMIGAIGAALMPTMPDSPITPVMSAAIGFVGGLMQNTVCGVIAAIPIFIRDIPPPWKKYG